jgi:hypothetical protein
VIRIFCGNPGCVTVGVFFFFPKRRFRFQPVDQECRAVQSCLAVGAGSCDQDDGISGKQATGAMDNGAA